MRLIASTLLLAACASNASNVSFGGAQDIGEFRSILDRGELPGPDTLDANGFFNEHFNATPPATCDKPLCLVPGVSVGRDWLTGAHQATLQIAVNTPLDPATFQRLPMNLAVVVDHSGSMGSDGRMTKVKAGLHTLIDNLQDTDRLAIVEFDDQVQIDTPLGETLDRAQLHAIVDRLQPRGSTDIFDGLQAGFSLLGDAPPSERQNRVIFLSDGLATAGNTSDRAIMAMAMDRVRRGIGLTTIGVGNEFDVELMRGLAEQGAGNFYYLDDPNAATEVFTEELDYFMQPIALDVNLSATAGPGYDFGEVVGSHIWSASPKTGSMAIPAVFMASRTSQSGEQGRRGGGSMLFIHLDPIAGNTGRVADLTLSFRVPGSSTPITQTVSLDYSRDPSETPADPYLSMPEMAERYAMYNMFLGFRLATKLESPGCAVAALEATRANAATWNATHEDPDLAADITLADQYLANLRAHGAPAEQPLNGCADATDPYQPGGNGLGYEGNQHVVYACSAGGAGGGLPIALALLLVRRRRR